jgi:anti-sigma regulatory factor (Ser/Thr protein kinase)
VKKIKVPAQNDRLGIFMVNSIVDDVRYRRKNGKNILTVSKEIQL